MFFRSIQINKRTICLDRKYDLSFYEQKEHLFDTDGKLLPITAETPSCPEGGCPFPQHMKFVFSIICGVSFSPTVIFGFEPAGKFDPGPEEDMAASPGKIAILWQTKTLL